jgi:aspartate/methionine/tyrosine aminotransferase
MINAKEARNLTHKNISFAIGEATEDTQRNIQRKIKEAIDRYESETGLEFINRYTGA